MSARHACERPDGPHSDDRVTCYVGWESPLTLCGFHAQEVLMPYSLRAVRDARDAAGASHV
jgi:hypothetical protein